PLLAKKDDGMRLVDAVLDLPTEYRGWDAADEDVSHAMADTIPKRIGLVDVKRLESATAHIRRWDKDQGSGSASVLALGLVQSVVSWRHASSTEDTRRRWCTAVSDLMGVAAFILYDSARHRAARQLWITAVELSQEAESYDLTSRLLRGLTHQSLYRNRLQEATQTVRLAELIASQKPVSRKTALMVTLYQAWICGKLGDRKKTERALTAAERTRNSAATEDDRPWLRDIDEGTVNGLEGLCYQALAVQDSKSLDTAESLLMSAELRLDHTMKRRRTFNRLALATVSFTVGDIDAGLTHADHGLQGISAVETQRAAPQLRDLYRAMVRHRSSSAVRYRLETLSATLAQ
ncbi:MAG: hypothetical protein ACRDQZ_14355, partial [Mycobacteriales bacterium]